MIEISASILAANILNLEQEIKIAANAGIDRIHIDIMDGHYVKNISFGSSVIPAIAKLDLNLPLDIHLMTTCTNELIQQCATEHVSSISFHPETLKDPVKAIQKIQSNGISAGIAINPKDQITDLKELIEIADEVLLMAVIPGACGQAFMPEVLEKITEIKELFNGRIVIDGGIKPAICKSLAVDCVVAGSALFYGDIENNFAEFAHYCK